ncbi:MAG TPA: short chain dehydrogenase [Pusillimonas sp.]|jgi:uncharacterized protein YbjT (DUF2867 family)|nr:short chain dehydrogenase [Pusillimonas sp.]|tara:strand:- start:66926 stop:68218 length:1293 start_codon:yes stop_codon:yes gene_type:complete
MKILLTGATGFIGSRLLDELLRTKCSVICVGRKRPESLPSRVEWIELDFNYALSAYDWAAAVEGVEVVVNAAGILHESPSQSFDIVHRAAPTALFQAAADANVRHIIQISALGADQDAQSRFHLSKKAADECLLSLGVRASIVQPSLVYGVGGASAELFGTFASMPLIPVPGRGDQQVQPIHIDDLIQAVLTLTLTPTGQSGRISMVGPEPLALRRFYAELRTSMGIRGKACFLPVPMALMYVMADAVKGLPGVLLDRETLGMLERGNAGDPADIARLLGRLPRRPIQFVRSTASHVAMGARLGWLLPMLRLSIALVWLVTGLVSLGLYPVDSSLYLLSRAGVPSELGPLFLYGAAGLDLALGVLTLWPRRSPWLWVAQAGLIVLYMAVITIKLPEFWLHPYGPLVKNIPMLGILWLLYEVEGRRWTTSS